MTYIQRRMTRREEQQKKEHRTKVILVSMITLCSLMLLALIMYTLAVTQAQAEIDVSICVEHTHMSTHQCWVYVTQ